MSSIIFLYVQGLSISPTLIFPKSNQLCKLYFFFQIGDGSYCLLATKEGALIVIRCSIALHDRHLSDFRLCICSIF